MSATTDTPAGAVPAAPGPEPTPEPTPEPSVEEVVAPGRTCPSDSVAVDRARRAADAIRRMAAALPPGPAQQRAVEAASEVEESAYRDEAPALMVREESGLLVLEMVERPTDVQIAELRGIAGRRWDHRRRVSTFPAASRVLLWFWIQRWYAGAMMSGPRGTQRVPDVGTGRTGGAS